MMWSSSFSSLVFCVRKRPLECGFMAHICVIVGSSSIVVTLETLSSSEAIIAVYANPVHMSNTAQSLPLYGFKEAILRLVSSFGSTPKPNRCMLKPAINAVGGNSGFSLSDGHSAHTLSIVLEYTRHGSNTNGEGAFSSLVQGRTTLYTVKSSGSTSNTSSRFKTIAFSSSFLLISTCASSIRISLFESPKSTVCSNVAVASPPFSSFCFSHSFLHRSAKHAVTRHFVASSSYAHAVLPDK